MARGDYRLDPEHPPLLRMWAALPLLAMRDIKLSTVPIDQAAPEDWVGDGPQINEFSFSHRFMYERNDADRMLYAARFMIVLLGVGLGVLLFSWAREWFGFWPALLVLAFYTVEPNLQAHASLVTTDFGITCLFFGTLYFVWRTIQRLSFGNVASLALFFALAVVSKFSAVVLLPIVVVLLSVPVLLRVPWSGLASRSQKAMAASGIGLLLVLTAWSTVWATYRFRHIPSSTAQWRFRVDNDSDWPQSKSMLRTAGAWIDEHHLLPNAYIQGFLLSQKRATGREYYLAGETSRDGWWYYFPLAILLKTPIALLLLVLGGIGLTAVKRTTLGRRTAFALAPLIIYLAIAMLSRLNIGLRHVLPIYPLALLISGACVAELLAAKSTNARFLLASLCLAWLLEFARVYPHTLAFFNQFAGGPCNGGEYLVDSNLDWGQDLKGLKRWMQRNNVEHINLSYFGTADPRYYGIDCTYIPGIPFWIRKPEPPKLPGYVAVSAQFLTGIGFNNYGKYFYQTLREQEPIANIGYSIRIFKVDHAWWGTGSTSSRL